MDDSSEERTVIYDPLVELIQLFEGVRANQDEGSSMDDLSIEDALKRHIVSGMKKGLETRLQTAMETYSPLDIINNILLDGMKTVGELFGAGKMQLPFVLQSAEAMKAAVRYLEPHMEKAEGGDRGSILLATVQGDVHDIGKNLVDIILSNNGYRVVNIGIKQPVDSILDAAKKNGCQVIGMSGLLVKSTVVMKDNLEVMNERGLSGIPVILGGAALTRAYVEQDLRSIYKGKVFYAQDAFEGLRLMEEIGKDEPVLDTAALDEVPVERVRSHRLPDEEARFFVFDGEKSAIEPLDEVPVIPFYGTRIWTKFDPFEIFRHINTVALFRGQWQFKKEASMSNPEFNAWLEENVQPIFQQMQNRLARVIKPAAKWGYFPCASSGNSLIIFEDDGKTERARFNFPRQSTEKRLCLADYFRSVERVQETGQPDVICLQIVTVGPDVTELEHKKFNDGDFQEYLFTHGMGVESAEALAEFWHKQVRHEMGIDDAEPQTMKEMFGAKYRGSRYSFGYPACPRVEDQRILFDLLKPEDIGVELTQEYMMSPEQSTSAIVVHHPEAKYFNIR